MYLSKLELHGFKSFAERTSMHFDPGVTAVVGPNGCGKSNIVDAVRWVIGEQRARILRSDKMESVIFNGTAKKRPLGMAEVMLTIENNRGILPVEYDEITVGRRLFRSGESEYLLNGVQCRLKDITDLFMDTGMGAGAYSVIELKMIEEILSENAQDRRRLFEEAAGITRYKSRRAQALRKLDNTQADLTRLRDLLDEIEKRVRSLKRQASKATRYKDVSERLRRLELSLSRLEFDRLNDQKSTLEKDIAGLRHELDAQIARHGESEAALEAMKLALLEREESFSKAQGALRTHLENVQRIESEIRLHDERIERGLRDLERSQREQTEAESRISELDRERASLTSAVDALAPEVDQSIARLEEAAQLRDTTHDAADAARQRLTGLRAAAQECSDAVADLLRRLDRQNSRLELVEADHEDTAQRLTDFDARNATTAVALEHASATAEERAAAMRHAQQQLDESIALEQARREQHDNELKVLREFERRAEALTAEIQLLESLVSSYEDASEAVRYLAEESDWTSYELRTVADVISCDDRYRSAVESALAHVAEYVVVRSTGELKRAVEKLRQSGRGRATFIVLDRLAAPTADLGPSPAGTLPLQRVVRTIGPDYEVLARVLFSNAYFVDQLDESLQANTAAGAKFFAASGEWIGATGLVHAGSANGNGATASAGARLGRREQLERVVAEREQLTGLMADQRAAVERAEKAIGGAGVAELREEFARYQQSAIEADKVLAQARFEHDSSLRRKAELSEKMTSLEETASALRSEIEQINATVEDDLRRLAELKQQVENAEEVFHATESDSRVALARYSEAHLASVELKNRLDNLQRDRERATAEQEALRNRITERTTHIRSVEDEIAASEQARAALRDEVATVKSDRESLEQAVDDAKNELHEGRSEISAIEHTLREIRRLKEDHQRSENQRAVKLAEVQTRIEELVRHIEEDYSVTIADVTVDEEAVAEEAAARREVVELRRQVRNMGPINELALEEYEEEQQRFEFMSKQLSDLTEAEKTLLQTIDEINTTASNRFMETFAAIQKNFEQLFSELFGSETSAEVLLEDPANPLESAIEVMARPRGKRPSVLAQLSGGEKTLTAIALLFSIYLVKPSPFCILDEVDAPLDDANVGRFMNIIRQFSSSTQFILVTHNKRTMEAADRMYGVTMQEQGVSSLVGVKFEEVHEVTAA